MARPTKYTEKLAKEICQRIADGESVRAIGRDETMPSSTTIFNWALNNKEFFEQYAQAKEIGMEQAIDELEQIARGEEDVQRAKLIIDTRKWIASKKFPKKYGDKSEVDVTSGGEPIKNINVIKTGKDS